MNCVVIKSYQIGFLFFSASLEKSCLEKVWCVKICIRSTRHEQKNQPISRQQIPLRPVWRHINSYVSLHVDINSHADVKWEQKTFKLFTSLLMKTANVRVTTVACNIKIEMRLLKMRWRKARQQQTNYTKKKCIIQPKCYHYATQTVWSAWRMRKSLLILEAWSRIRRGPSWWGRRECNKSDKEGNSVLCQTDSKWMISPVRECFVTESEFSRTQFPSYGSGDNNVGFYSGACSECCSWRIFYAG